MNALPGLKSVASATAAPASTSARAGRHRPIEKERARRQQARRRRRSRRARARLRRLWPRGGRPSARASSTASGIAPHSVNWSPCRRSASPASRHALEVAARLRGVEGAALEEDVGCLGDRRRLGQDLAEREVEVGVGVGELGRHRVRPEIRRRAARLTDRAQGGELRLPVEAVAGLPLPRRRPVLEHPRGVAPNSGAQAVLAERHASRGRSRGSRRPRRAAPRSPRLPRGARTPRRGRRPTPDACGSRRGPGSRRARARRAPPPRRRSPRRSRMRPTASMRSPSQRTKASSSTSTSPSCRPAERAWPRGRRRELREVADEQARHGDVSRAGSTSARADRARAPRRRPRRSRRRGDA